jgi:hypothetical protein
MPIVPSVDAPVADVDVEEPIPDAAKCKNYICVLYGKHRIVSSLNHLDGSIFCGRLIEKLNPQ